MSRAATLGVLALAGLLALPGAGLAAGITAANDARPVGNGRWEWTIFVQAEPAVIRSIACVVYTLHPTFPDPVRPVCEPGDARRPFALQSNGWGVFEIAILVRFKNGREERLRHKLVFDRDDDRSLAVRAANVAEELRPGWWRWTVFVEGSETALDRIRCVEYRLHPTFPDPVRRVCRRGTGSRAFALSSAGWGTFEVGLRLLLRDGTTEELRHHLKF